MDQANDLGWSLGVLLREWRRVVGAAAEGIPHGPRGFQVLQALGEGEAPRQGELAGHLGIDRTVLTYVIDDLVGAGLVQRQPDPADRRAQRLALTDGGRDRLAALCVDVAAGERHLLAGLPEADRGPLLRAIGRAAAALHADDGTHDACRVIAELER